jgi:hypothetical protein
MLCLTKWHYEWQPKLQPQLTNECTIILVRLPPKIMHENGLKKSLGKVTSQDHNNITNMHTRVHLWEVVESEVGGEAIPWKTFTISKPIMGLNM